MPTHAAPNSTTSDACTNYLASRPEHRREGMAPTSESDLSPLQHARVGVVVDCGDGAHLLELRNEF